VIEIVHHIKLDQLFDLAEGMQWPYPPQWWWLLFWSRDYESQNDPEE
jgi:hypothetical protein